MKRKRRILTVEATIISCLLIYPSALISKAWHDIIWCMNIKGMYIIYNDIYISYIYGYGYLGLDIMLIYPSELMPKAWHSGDEACAKSHNVMKRWHGNLYVVIMMIIIMIMMIMIIIPQTPSHWASSYHRTRCNWSNRPYLDPGYVVTIIILGLLRGGGFFRG